MKLLWHGLPLMLPKNLDIVNLMIQKLMKCVIFMLSCIVTPFLKLQYFKKRKRIPAIKNQLLLISATEIARQIRKKVISSEEVVRAYVERCTDVNPVINAIVDSRFNAAIQEAQEVDKLLASTTKTEEELAHETPFLGVPITVKESFAVEGMSYMVGVKKKSSQKATENASVVSLVRKAGAIVLLVSNTPELCLNWETNNKVTGTTKNPYDTRKTPGGSSGGEAALISSAASIAGIVSDIAGSARLPAMFCGVFGHRPTSGLVSAEGHRPYSHDESFTVYYTPGAMVRYAEDLSLMMRIMCRSEETRKKFEQKVCLKDIKFYYLEDCCVITNSINKDVKQAMKKLRTYIETTYGFKVEKARLPAMEFALNISAFMLSINLDDINDDIECVGSSKCLLEELKCLCGISQNTLSSVTYATLKWIYHKLPGSYQVVFAKTEELKKQFEELLGDNGVLIYPTFVSSAYYANESYMNIPNFMYLTIANVLGIPATHCTMGLDKQGLPVGLQIMANTGNDHLTIAVAKEIDEVFGGWQPPPMIELQL
ncbi:fatty-acid amide hydrolase 2 isoform X2 [Bombus terrestris]|uniref:Fatty-acid amide hydrolase 2 isoform X2 n=2 Tax=Bombus terrestris TaxID=30195 RepID=A0A9B2JMU6_BOMTE|nr:fatty-acid amide hydrolase 2 isoform X2 [Bombus terrestris]